MGYQVIRYGLSHKGLVRQNNEDFWGELPHEHFFALADGMGGHRAGEVAAKEAVTTVCHFIEERHRERKLPSSLPGMRRELINAIELANEHVFRMGRHHPACHGMGTTLCCIFFHPQGVVYGHVGDSRIYRYRLGHLEQITRDDSLVRELIDQGQLDDQQASEFIHRNILTKAIGTEGLIEPTVHYSNIMLGDIYMMCSDGLTDLISFHEISHMLRVMTSQKKAAEHFVNTAIQRGGYDNITVVIMSVVSDDTEKSK